MTNEFHPPPASLSPSFSNFSVHLSFEKKIFTVSELTCEIESLFENQFASVWLKGEISNFKAHSSGHFYFSLKDSESQIQAVCFRGVNRLFRFKIEDGLEVRVQGKINVYKPRGSYQIVIESMEPLGLGELQLAFEQLKRDLASKGFFEATRKRKIPFLPRKIGVITSPTGAVVRDLIHVLTRRFPGIGILLYPVRVQGVEAIREIVMALQTCNQDAEVETIILARGGGSIEDLWAFNTREVAEALFASKIPVISAIGHETDYTISDFVSDLRAPTPSAAAEMAVPVCAELVWKLKQCRQRLIVVGLNSIKQNQDRLLGLKKRFKDPKRRLEELWQILDESQEALQKSWFQPFHLKLERLAALKKQLCALSPFAVLDRGYAIAYQMGDKNEYQTPITHAGILEEGDRIKVQVATGSFEARVISSLNKLDDSSKKSSL